MSMRRVMIEEQVVSGVQVAARLQERPYAIERRLPCSGDITEGDRGASCRHKFRPRNLHANIIFHGLESFRTCSPITVGNIAIRTSERQQILGRLNRRSS